MRMLIGLLAMLFLIGMCWRTFPYFTTGAIIAFIFFSTTGVN